MVRDDVNAALAIGDIGIAIGFGSDAAKETGNGHETISKACQ
ncbi:hypothetical protein [Mesorhizobium sp.]|nr:hypothetical protein [Mesorhizobium sp.]